MIALLLISGSLAVLLAGGWWILRQVRQRHLDRWLVPYVLQAPQRRRPRSGEEVHLLLCLADHYEPKAGGVSPDESWSRVQRWVTEYPHRLGSFRDSDGRTPRHTFFYPAEEYEPEYLDALAELCRRGFGEVEVHLHHDGDTADNLRTTLEGFKTTLAQRHGLLSRHRRTGRLMYGFIHGNWALDNSRPDGRWCGVDNELSVLQETGCYADFTLPSAPSPTQTRQINSIYYARGVPGCRKSHDRGVAVGTGRPPEGSLLLVQGPLLFNWRQRKHGLLPRLENGCVQASQPACRERLDRWLSARIQVPSRPDWFFVKLYAHGAPAEQHEALFGAPMVRFHQELAQRARADAHFHYHYVTAREMFNLVKAAEAGWQGTVSEALDYELLANQPAWEAGSGSRSAAASPSLVNG
jgi:hypothetical protein